MKEKKLNKKLYYIFGSIILVVLMAFIVIYLINYGKKNYSFQEKQFINNNKNNVIDISLEGSLPLFSDNGEGVFYNFINGLKEDTNLNIDISVNGTSDYKLQTKNNISTNDIVVYIDDYVLINSTNKTIYDLNDISNQEIGVLESDLDYIKNYLVSYNLTYKTYSNITSLINDMNDSIIYAILPNYKYIDQAIYNKYSISYHIEGLNSNYVITLGDNETLNSIIKKYYNKYEENILDDINTNLYNLYTKVNGLSEIDSVSLTNNDVIVGYIDNLPLEGKINYDFVGLTDEYLELFSKMSNTTYKYVKYKNIDDLTEALNNKKIDVILNTYNISNGNYTNSNTIGNIRYSVLVHKDNNLIVNNISSISDRTIKTINNTSIFNYLKNKNINVSGYENYKKLNNELTESDVLVVEKSAYEFYKNDKYSDYIESYIGYTNNGYSFLLNNDNTVFNNLFNFYITSISYSKVENYSLMKSLDAKSTNIIIEFVLSNLFYLLIVFAILIVLWLTFKKKIKVTKKIKRDDKLMYLDVMTNLKNRNYLNDNLNYWEENKIFPQAIVMMDLKSISIINDTKGHEEGDKQIKSAANILIRTQRENSEIIRTDGNEFLVYLVGYEEKQVSAYVNKLIKEFKSLHYNYGVAIGYYMINSESTTIDDAINEALIRMRNNKEE